MQTDLPVSVYLDTNALIRIFEGDDKQLGPMLFGSAETGLLLLFTSEFTLAEILVTPLREGNAKLVAIYEHVMLSEGLLKLIPVDRALFRRTAELRAAIGNKAADAIHIVTAAGCGCSVFLSDDARIRLPAGLTKMSLNQAATLDKRSHRP